MSKEVLEMNGWNIETYVPYCEVFEMKIFLAKKPKANQSFLNQIYSDKHLQRMVQMMKEMEDQKVFLEDPSCYLGKGYGKGSLTITFDEPTYIKLKQNKITINNQALSDMLREVIEFHEEDYKDHVILILKATGNTRNVLLDLTEEIDLDITPIFEVNK